MSDLLDLALHAAQLKRMPRSGWQIRGAPIGGQPESVAAHSYGVVFLTMLLVDLDERDLDREQALRIAVLHDLAESLVGDLPRTVSRFIPPALKHQAEETAMQEIVGMTPLAACYLADWNLYAEGTTAEAQVVKDADKLDMMLQAFLYEQAGQRNLDDFWRNVTPDRFHTATARALYATLRERRAALRRDEG